MDRALRTRYKTRRKVLSLFEENSSFPESARSYRFNHTRLPKKEKKTLQVRKLTSCMETTCIEQPTNSSCMLVGQYPGNASAISSKRRPHESLPSVTILCTLFGQYKTWTADYGLRTGYKTRPSGIKHRLSITDWV